ncbi:Protein OSB3, chloroplastic/mitochondrial [Quillaja saponaria]|uniref:Protein OSB3, chloroplastic/mitochondrial n=1 Tax=Quillaja saponaria TaxID=32244 RepID=A0AAD7PEX9_QUISA|nr:Protein OSB3, chloroplastic/mitochondrial [Quillaja saponaria]
MKTPDKWWDNRDRRRSPGFKTKKLVKHYYSSLVHSWMMSKMPPLRPEHGGATGNRQTTFLSVGRNV